MQTPRAIPARRRRHAARRRADVRDAAADPPKGAEEKRTKSDDGNGAIETSDKPAAPPRTLEDLSPEDARALLEDLMLGRCDPGASAEEAGLALREMARLLKWSEAAPAINSAADLIHVQHFAKVAQLKAQAAKWLGRLLKRIEPKTKIDSLRSTKVMIDLCVELLKLPEPG